MKRCIILLIALSLFAAGCGETTQPKGDDRGLETESSPSYRQITQKEAMRMMEEENEYTILDVRTWEEYDAGHIPGAICVPNETIDDYPPDELPDFDEIILVYCRSGRRSKEAAAKLAQLGYTAVFEFGGIITWSGEIVTDEQTPAAAPDPAEKTDGAEQEAPGERRLRLSIDGFEVDAEWEDNAAVSALSELASESPLVIDMSMYGGFEQVGSIGSSLPRQDTQITTAAGDIVLYAGDQLVIFYGSNSWSYTRLGRIVGQTPEELAQLLGNGAAVITITLE